jgi:adenylylsulfate kinase-like enzyme
MLLNPSGKLFWVTGLAGAGKSTIGKLLYEHLKKNHPNTIYIDGDVMRWVLGDTTSYSPEDRKRIAFQYARFSKMLVDQDMFVVCSTISMFHEVRDWNRNNIENYKEIYIKVPLAILIGRDQKGLYTSAKKGEQGHVIGINQDFEEPKSPDIVLLNDGSQTPPQILDILLKELNL